MLLSERDPLTRQEAGSDLLRRLDWLGQAGGADGPRRRLRQLQAQLRRQVRQLPSQQKPPPQTAAAPTATTSNATTSTATTVAQLVAAAFSRTAGPGTPRTSRQVSAQRRPRGRAPP
ncbi:hypothetical protein [Cyanobium sp. ATX-6F1]|uniref:hypothetical protein n=1 Tax=Cyanobium sp. ATX-6F1 TaxID=3137388 RepID=UPI0039BE49D7